MGGSHPAPKIVKEGTPDRSFRLLQLGWRHQAGEIMAQATTLNPALRSDAFTQARQDVYRAPGTGAIVTADNVMTLNGTIGKCFITLLLLAISAAWVWRLFLVEHNPAAVMPWMWGGAIGGFIVAMITIFKRQAAPFTAPLYAVLQGFLLGATSAFFQMQYPGIVVDAVLLTMAICAAMLLAYASRIIQPTNKFMLGLTAATGGVMIFYLVTMFLGFFHIHVPLVFASGPIGIGFSVIVIIIAALNLVVDFSIIETGINMRAPKYMEWYGAFALMVTLVWLYLELLRLLAKTRSRD